MASMMGTSVVHLLFAMSVLLINSSKARSAPLFDVSNWCKDVSTPYYDLCVSSIEPRMTNLTSSSLLPRISFENSLANATDVNSTIGKMLDFKKPNFGPITKGCLAICLKDYGIAISNTQSAVQMAIAGSIPHATQLKIFDNVIYAHGNISHCEEGLESHKVDLPLLMSKIETSRRLAELAYAVFLYFTN